MNALVGYTGFVGSNLYSNGIFDSVYNSQNIEQAFDTNPDLLIYAGLRAEKYLANKNSEKDLKLIENAEKNISKINPKKLVLISTIDVFKNPFNVDENSKIETNGLNAYGYNRYLLECRVRDNYKNALIVRLPALFGKNIKKNFIYDYINIIPFMLDSEKFAELSKKESILKNYYEIQSNGFYKLKISDDDREKLKTIFLSLGFSALNFTDSRSIFQFYNLKNLWKDINIALEADIKLLHLASEPLSAGELYEYLSGKKFVNELKAKPAFYDYRTVHDKLFGGADGYIYNKNSIMEEIKNFVTKELQNNEKK